MSLHGKIKNSNAAVCWSWLVPAEDTSLLNLYESHEMVVKYSHYWILKYKDKIKWIVWKNGKKITKKLLLPNYFTITYIVRLFTSFEFVQWNYYIMVCHCAFQLHITDITLIAWNWSWCSYHGNWQVLQIMAWCIVLLIV